MTGRLWLLAVFLTMAGCGSVPRDGPTGGSVERLDSGYLEGGYKILDLDYRASQIISQIAPGTLADLSPISSTAELDRLGEGDVIAITVFEPGGGLFGDSRGIVVSNAPETIPRIVIDRSGNIDIPFAGPVAVSGLTTREAAAVIQQALLRKTADPQVVVSLVSNVSNTVTVIGEVRSAGLFPVGVQNDTLLDVIAASGGPTRPTADLEVILLRNGTAAAAPLDTVLGDPRQNIRVSPRDQIRIVYRPRTFSTFGSFAKIAQNDIGEGQLTLAGAISRSGGLLDRKADASSVLLFRFERAEVAKALGIESSDSLEMVPVIYRLDMSDPSSFFVANNFRIQNDDLLYVPQADLAEMQKFFEFVRSATQVAFDVRAVGLTNN